MKLKKMTEEEYNTYIEKAKANYEIELVRSGRFDNTKDAHEFAIWEYDDIFKDGYRTSEVYLYHIVVEKEKVGIIWFINEDEQVFPGEAFIGDFFIEEDYRRKGYGTQALHLIEDEVKKLGLKEIRLGVMAHNTSAKRLYERVGYTLFKQREHDCVMRLYVG